MSLQSRSELARLAFVLSTFFPLLVNATPLSTSDAPSIVSTSRAPKPTLPSRRPHGGLSKRQEQTITCATLDGYPTEWAAPYACSGSSPQCTTIGPLLGCCDEGDCTLYETCYNAVDSAYCTGSCTNTALVCGNTAPSCSAYNVIDKTTTGVWTAFSCGISSITLQGSPASGMLALPTQITSYCQIETSTDLTSSSTYTQITSTTESTTSTTSIVTILTLTSSKTRSEKLSSDTSTSLTLLPPPTGPSSTQTRTTTTTTPSSSGSVAASSAKAMSHTEIGAAAGGAVAGALVIGAAIFYFVNRANKKRRQIYPKREMQNYNGDRSQVSQRKEDIMNVL